jgi:tetratricopeptide (TPR) repeat protein
LATAVVAAAPLAAGGVHRPSLIVLMSACALALTGLVVSSSAHRPLRTSVAVALPLILLAIPLLQSVPLPMGVRGALDGDGNAILSDNDLVDPRAWPLSLDPPLTREYAGKAAAAVAIFLIAYHLASGQTKRHLMARTIGLSGVAVVVIGLGHKILGFSEIYGLFVTQPRSLLAGPFVNANHTAEFLELATFTCVACAFHIDNILNRYGWLTAALLCASGAIATMSRGALVAFAAGGLLFVLSRAARRDQGSGTGSTSRFFAWAAGLSLSVIGIAFALGAGALIDRFKTTSLADEARFQLWRDAFRVLAAHPAGIGRGAFDHVYPIYRTVKSPFPITYAFLECHPLQLLVDSGWLLFLAILAGVALVVREIVKRGRRDRIEAALLAGLVAVVAHSFLDFALETLGVALPFFAVLGTVLGRCHSAQAEPPSRRSTWIVAGATCASLVFGIVGVALPSHDDFDKLLKRAKTVTDARAILRRAQLAHPTDYFFAFAYAKTEPARPVDGRSPRLHALNRALRLCPGCEQVHAEVARTLWKMGRRSQSLVEWRAAVQSQPPMFTAAMKELWSSGARPSDLAALASIEPAKMVEAADFLAGNNKLAEAISVLDEADAMGAPHIESLLARCRLQIQLGHVDEAATTLAEARSAGNQDPRVAVLDAKLTIAKKGQAGVNEAFAILDLAATRFPLDVSVQRSRIEVVSDHAKWQAADRAIDGFKFALYRATGQAVEANLAAARIRAQLGQWRAAFSEYRTALSQASNDVSIWLAFAQTAEQAGRDSTAREAYTEAARLRPQDSGIAAALRRIETRQGYLRNNGAPPSLEAPGLVR